DMVYQNVARALLGGWEGTAGSIPGSVTENQVVTKTYSYTLPAAWDENEIELIGVVIEQTTGEVWNAVKSDIVTAVGEANFEREVVVFPNPSRDRINIRNAENTTITVYSMLGQEVAKVTAASAYESIDLSAQPEGTYIVRVQSDERIFTGKIVLVK
ncbi:MAG: T9SS type A sorting domain-containing protein, partial [Bacteroidetes bacterium]|nr:T9SS type A sorting domain-containing protein [Bacteroidota bacterium]